MSDANEVYERILVATLQRAVEFLKFAEAKNAALLALSSAWVLASINLECSGRSLPSPFRYAVPVASVFALCGALLAAFSFFPRLNLSSYLGGKRAGPHRKNLLYFGDIASLTVKSLEQDLRARYYPANGKLRAEYLDDLTTQISVNSSIAVRKIRLFSGGVIMMILAGAVLLFSAFIVVYVAVRGAA